VPMEMQGTARILRSLSWTLKCCLTRMRCDISHLILLRLCLGIPRSGLFRSVLILCVRCRPAVAGVLALGHVVAGDCDNFAAVLHSVDTARFNQWSHLVIKRPNQWKDFRVRPGFDTASNTAERWIAQGRVSNTITAGRRKSMRACLTDSMMLVVPGACVRRRSRIRVARLKLRPQHLGVPSFRRSL